MRPTCSDRCSTATADIGRPKVELAAQRIREINPDVDVNTYPVRFDVDNAFDLVDAYDIVVDGTDNFATRYLVNDACVLRGKPNVYGSIFRFEGQVSVFGTSGGPCYRCLFAEPPPPTVAPMAPAPTMTILRSSSLFGPAGVVSCVFDDISFPFPLHA